MSLNRRSKSVTHGVERTPNRAMLRAVGFGDGDFDKAVIGVANGYSTITPCNAGLNGLADRAMQALREAQTMPANVRDHHRQRRHLDGHRRHEVLARFARSNC